MDLLSTPLDSQQREGQSSIVTTNQCYGTSILQLAPKPGCLGTLSKYFSQTQIALALTVGASKPEGLSMKGIEGGISHFATCYVLIAIYRIFAGTTK